ncbi:MAG: hypothetical protein Alis3KO_17260 [Aliiglaciecola sp.]|uniref:hypothetical protein n=1 Tax=Aliiglaciecola sp. M165 TaxID=2593649 RepID=UPI00117C1932|nr:hypothetical protein [Aliiglaciecola sp. M165]TRY30370.1 hypothetical protein FM019_16305 [Aliiglaciecola sp. M165]
MEIGSSNNAAVSQTSAPQQVRQAETSQRQAELETPAAQPSTAENSPTPDSRVGSVINTQA